MKDKDRVPPEVEPLFVTGDFYYWNRRRILRIECCVCALIIAAFVWGWASGGLGLSPVLAGLSCAVSIIAAVILPAVLALRQARRQCLFIHDSRIIINQLGYVDVVTFRSDAPVRVAISKNGKYWRLESTADRRLKAKLPCRAYPTLTEFLEEMEAPFDLVTPVPSEV